MAFLLHRDGVPTSTMGCDHLNPVRQLFVPKIHDFRSRGEEALKPSGGYQNLQNHRFWAQNPLYSCPFALILGRHGAPMSSTGCELLNIIRQLFVPKIHDFRSSGGRSVKTLGGSQNPKIIGFELKTAFRVVRSPSYLVVMEYPWVLRVATFWTSFDNFSS